MSKSIFLLECDPENKQAVTVDVKGRADLIIFSIKQAMAQHPELKNIIEAAVYLDDAKLIPDPKDKQDLCSAESPRSNDTQNGSGTSFTPLKKA